MADFVRLKKGDAVLIAMLASGSTITDAAKSAGVSERTARRRMGEQEFCCLVNEARAALVSEATGALAASMSDAASTLKELLKAQSDRTRLAAARSIIWLGIKAREASELEGRLLELERAIS